MISTDDQELVQVQKKAAQELATLAAACLQAASWIHDEESGETSDLTEKIVADSALRIARRLIEGAET